MQTFEFTENTCVSETENAGRMNLLPPPPPPPPPPIKTTKIAKGLKYYNYKSIFQENEKMLSCYNKFC